MSLTYLQLSLDSSFASFPKGHLSLVVLGHDLHKLPGEHSVLRTKTQGHKVIMCCRLSRLLLIQLRVAYPSCFKGSGRVICHRGTHIEKTIHPYVHTCSPFRNSPSNPVHFFGLWEARVPRPDLNPALSCCEATRLTAGPSCHPAKF